MQHRILVTNDDGINAPGLAVMERVARQFTDDVWVVAPDFEKSGASRSVSLGEPVRVQERGDKRYALLRGTPTDCVVIALDHVMRESPPTLVLSGVNRGANLAEDLTFSGTCAAAMEATNMGIRAIAMSQLFPVGGTVRWQTTEAHAPRIVRALLDVPTPRGAFHNVNFPDVEPDQIKGVRAVPQGKWGKVKLNVDARIDPRNFPYAWLSFTHDPAVPPDLDTDIGAATSGWITVTPLDTDITWREGLGALAKGLAGL